MPTLARQLAGLRLPRIGSQTRGAIAAAEPTLPYDVQALIVREAVLGERDVAARLGTVVRRVCRAWRKQADALLADALALHLRPRQAKGELHLLPFWPLWDALAAVPVRLVRLPLEAAAEQAFNGICERLTTHAIRHLAIDVHGAGMTVPSFEVRCSASHRMCRSVRLAQAATCYAFLLSQLRTIVDLRLVLEDLVGPALGAVGWRCPRLERLAIVASARGSSSMACGLWRPAREVLEGLLDDKAPGSVALELGPGGGLQLYCIKNGIYYALHSLWLHSIWLDDLGELRAAPNLRALTLVSVCDDDGLDDWLYRSGDRWRAGAVAVLPRLDRLRLGLYTRQRRRVRERTFRTPHDPHTFLGALATVLAPHVADRRGRPLVVEAVVQRRYAVAGDGPESVDADGGLVVRRCTPLADGEWPPTPDSDKRRWLAAAERFEGELWAALPRSKR